MNCNKHPAVPALDRCAGCAEPFCANCLVEVSGQKYCGDCKVMAVKVTPVLEEPTLPCKEANEALTFAIVGLFCCSLIFGPIAISKASQAKKLIQADSRLAGAEKANAAMITGIISIVLAVLNIISRAAHTKGL